MSNIKYLKLRFPEFTGEWEVRKLGELIKVNMCKRIFSNQTASIGEVPFYKIGTLGDKADSYISRELFEEYKDKYNYPRKGEILITCSGTVGKTVIYDGRDSYYQDSNIVWLNNDNKIICNSIIKIIISRIDWNRKLNSTTITRLYNDDIRSLIIEFPTEKEEQQKIGDFFMLLDKRIEQQEQKIALLKDYKKAMMQRIFSQKIRFKDENGNDYPDWEEKKFLNIFFSIPSRAYQIFKTEIFSNGKIPVVDQGKKKVAGYSNEIKKICDKTPCIVFGDHTTELKYIDFPFIIGADGTKILRNHIANSTLFLYYLLLENNVEQEGYKRHFSILTKKSFDIPMIKEQEKIASFLSTIDFNIEKQEGILENLKNQKGVLLHKMFI